MAITFNNPEQLIHGTYDGYIYQKVLNSSNAEVWKKVDIVMYRRNQPNTANNGDLYLDDNTNTFYIYNNGWQELSSNVYFTEAPLNPSEGYLNDYNILSGIYEIRPIVKFGNGENILIKDLPEGSAIVKDGDKRLYVKNSFGLYMVKYRDKTPSNSYSMINAMILNTDLWKFYIQKHISR